MPDAPATLINNASELVQLYQYILGVAGTAIVALFALYIDSIRRGEARRDAITDRCQAHTEKAFAIVEANTTVVAALRESHEDMLELERLRQIVSNKAKERKSSDDMAELERLRQIVRGKGKEA